MFGKNMALLIKKFCGEIFGWQNTFPAILSLKKGEDAYSGRATKENNFFYCGFPYLNSGICLFWAIREQLQISILMICFPSHVRILFSVTI